MTSPPDAPFEVPRHLLDRERAQRSDTWICVVAIVLSAVFLVAAAALQRPINQRRADLQLVTHSDIRNVPPKYAWITAMAGTFRALAVDLLWIRLENQKEEGRVFEAQQLARWICDLYPRFASVWRYQSWNMAYNISVTTHTPEERWQWVYAGIRLMRDEAIPNNPRVVGLYHELAWTIFHKIGEMLDDKHNFYKREWAAMFENLLGSPPMTVTIQPAIDAFRPVAEAPASWAEFVAKHPEVEPHVASLKDAGVDVHAKTSVTRLQHPLEATFFDRYGRFVAGAAVETAKYRATEAKIGDLDRRFIEAYRAMPPDLAGALVAYLRAKVLREQYKMDPAFMLSLMANLVPGRPDLPVPLDWRTPEAHAIYWSRYGVEQGRKLKNYSDIDVLNTDRLTLFSLMNLCKRGLLIFELNRDKPNRSALNMLPDLRMVSPMHEMFLALGKVHAEPGENVGQTAGEMLRSGHVNTLEEAIVLFYVRGETAPAQKYYAYLRANYKEPDGSTKQRYLTDLETFVVRQIASFADTHKDSVALIHAFLTGAYLSLAAGDGNAFAQQVTRAGAVWNKYMADNRDTRDGRLLLPPFAEMRADALSAFLIYTPTLLPRVAVWRAEDDAIRRIAYNTPDFVEALREKCTAAGYDFDKAFPEPPGMAEYRKTHPPRTLAEDAQAAVTQKAGR